MASQSLTNRAQLLREVRESVPPADLAQTEQEVAFLKMYRQANEANKRRVVKLLHAARAGALPPPEVSAKWGPNDVREFADTLPEVQ